MLDPILVGAENETFFMKVWKPFSNRRVLKTLRGNLEGKTQRGQYLLAVDLNGELDIGRCASKEARP